MTTPPEPTLLYLIKQVELAVRSQLDRAVAPFGLTSLQYTALTVLERRPGMTSAELARNSFVRPQTMSQTIAHLEELGYLRKEGDTSNRRKLLLVLTDNGRRVLGDSRDAVDAIEREMLGSLTDSEAWMFRRALSSARVAIGGGHPH